MLWDNNKRTNIHIIRVPERDEDSGAKKIFEEIIPGNLPNLKGEKPYKPIDSRN